MLQDAFGRTVEYMRVSVTDRCNLRCRYCMPEEGIPLLTHDDILRFDEIAAVMKVAVEEDVRSVRLTGGEPLIKRGILELVRSLGSIPGLQDLALTTNGVLLASMAADLRKAGLHRVNIGLPSLDTNAYASITRCSNGTGGKARDAIEAALEAGLSPVKVNVVMMRGTNDDPTPWLELIRRLPIEVRFIEYMPIGPEKSAELFLSAADMERRVRALAGDSWTEAPRRAGRGPVQKTWKLGDSAGSIGFIHAISEHFCAKCNRLRLTADGRLRTCLFSDDELDLKPGLRPTIDSGKIREILLAAVQAKPRCIPIDPHHGRRLMGQVGG